MVQRIITYIKRGLRYVLTGMPVRHISANISLLNPNSNLIGKKILITGGSRGLGKAMAIKFMAEGGDVVITGRDEGALKEIAETSGCKYIVGDIMDETFLRTLIDKSVSLLGGLNVLVNNAGISLHEGDLYAVTEEGFDRQFSINLRAPFFLSKGFINYLKDNNIEGSSILFISSERSQQADIIPYGLTKAAINSFVSGLAKRYVKEGLRVNAVAPGVTATDMTGMNETDNLYYEHNSRERAYIPEEVAEVASFLISDASTCLSGQILVCNEAKTINSYF